MPKPRQPRPPRLQRVRLALGGARDYDILIGRGALAEAARLPQSARASTLKAFVIADARLTGPLRRLQRALRAQGWQVVTFTEAASEALKDLRRVYPLYGKLLRAGADRDSVIFALGGGVIGDAAGFVAATFLRGVKWVGVPTTLLAQLDSSIGGKTGVNHEAGKNLVGAVHQPALVACETSVLRTLELRDRVSGLGEMIKYALAYDARFFGFIEKNWSRILKLDESVLVPALVKCARLKAAVVARDEHDRQGVREVLNLGHTLGHALEAAGGYGLFRHGEAVLYGLRAALHLSVARGHLAPAARDRFERLFDQLPLASIPERVTSAKIRSYVKFDKKAEAGRVRFVLLTRLGATVSDRDVSDAELRAAIAHMRS